MLEKLKSRKFLAGILTPVLMLILIQVLGLEPEVALMIVSSIIAWIFGEAYVDGRRAGNETRTDA